MCDFAKSIQTNINNYVTRDRINDASFRQNHLELVFEDISTFDANNPISGSLLREIDLNKKQTDSEFIKSLPSHPGKEFEIQKHLDRLRGIKRFDNKNNKNNNNDDGCVGGGFFVLGPTTTQNKNISSIPGVFDINEILNLLFEEYDVQQRLNRQVPEVDDLLQQRLIFKIWIIWQLKKSTVYQDLSFCFNFFASDCSRSLRTKQVVSSHGYF